MILRIAIGYLASLIRMILQTGLWLCLIISVRGVWTRATLLKDLLDAGNPEVFFLGLITWQLTFITAILCGGFILLYFKDKK